MYLPINNQLKSDITYLKLKYHKNFNLGDNVSLLPALDRKDLVTHYNTTSIYAQLSRSEGLPNVLCEAMLCGCIPVGSPVFGIPKAVTIPEGAT